MHPRLPLGLPVALSCLVGCNGPAVPATAPQPSALSDEGDPLDITGLSSDTKSRFESQRITVVDSDTNASSYAFMNRDGEVAADAFVGRYHTVTGEADIDQVTRANPGTPLIAVGSVGFAGGLFGSLVLLGMASQTETTCRANPGGNQVCFDQASSSSPSQTAAIGGAIGLSALGIVGAVLILSGVQANRNSHELSRDDAERFARRYNRALLRNLRRSTEPSEPQPRDAGAPPG